jgi:Zn-finger nucleic acid-binding protein
MFRVKCPACGGILMIDERLRRVVDHIVPGQPQQNSEEKLGSILHSIEKSKSEQEAKLAAAKERESQRKQHIEELFKKAQEKAKEAGEDDKPQGPVWD